MSDELDCSTVSAANIKLSQGAQQIPVGDFACSGNPTVITFKPQQQLAYLTEYTLEVEGLVDQQKRAIPDCHETFSTKARTVAVSTNPGVNLSLDEDGTLWTWGDRLGGAFEDHHGPSDIPEKVALGGKVVAFVAGPDGFGLAAVEDGTLWSWGTNYGGQLGRPTTETFNSRGQVPMTLPTGVTIKALAASPRHTLALRSDGKVMAFGQNGAGQLGDGTQNDQPAPIEIPGLSDVVAISANEGSSGQWWSLAVKSDGTVWAWGGNANGQIEQPVTDFNTRFLVPKKLDVPAATAVAAANQEGFALTNEKTLYAWGSGLFGALGTNTCGDVFGPAPVLTSDGSTPLGGVVAVAGGGHFGLALKSDGTVWGWGWNYNGVLGDGTLGPSVPCGTGTSDHTQALPVQARRIANAIAISAGGDQSMIVLRDGTVWAAGYNSNDKLGVGADAPVVSGTSFVADFAQVPGL